MNLFFTTRLEGMDVSLLVISMVYVMENILPVPDIQAFADLRHNGLLVLNTNALMQGRIMNVVFIEPNGKRDNKRNVIVYGKSGHVFGNNKLL